MDGKDRLLVDVDADGRASVSVWRDGEFPTGADAEGVPVFERSAATTRTPRESLSSREGMSVAVEMIPDRPGREVAFEPLLDPLLEVFSPSWVLPRGMAGRHQRHRCEVKRWEIGRAAEADPDLTREHADALMRAVVHDPCRSGINQLVRPLVRALGHRWTQERIIHYVRTGSAAEQAGATMAWYFAGPGLRYTSADGDPASRVPTPESKAALDALSDLRARYRQAVLTAFLACDDPGTRQDLARWISRDASAYPVTLQAEHERATRLLLTEQARCRHQPVRPAAERRPPR
jgi:hypothetical protein